MSGTFQDYLENAELSLAAYAIGLMPGMLQEDYEAALRDAGMTDTQAATFASSYSIVDQFTDPASGFSATVFQKDGRTFLALRGVELDIWNAGIGDVLASADLTLGGPLGDGIAATQTVAMYNYFQRLQAAEGTPVAQLQYLDGTLQLVEDAGIGIGAPLDPLLTLAGHSLGGHLAMAFGRLFGGYVDQVFTYNAPGFSDPDADAFFAEMDSALGVSHPSYLGDDQSTNLYASNGVSVAAGMATTYGADVPIFIEEGLLFQNHLITRLTDSLLVYSLFEKIHPGISGSTIAGLLNASSSNVTRKLESAVDRIGKAFGSGLAPIADAEQLYVGVNVLKQTIPSSGLSIETLVGLTVSVPQARSDIGLRYALRELDPFVVRGISYETLHNGDGQLGIYNTPTEIGITDKWLEARATFLAALNTFNSANGNQAPSEIGAYFADQRLGVALGSAPLDVPHYLFAKDTGANPLIGSVSGDFLFGGTTSDVIVAGGGDDYIEGGDGIDLIDGHDGADEIHAGPGTDYVEGKRGDDQLAGGLGLDLYQYSGSEGLFGGLANDGNDTIRDSDGNGLLRYTFTETGVFFDTVQSTIIAEASVKLSDTQWQSADGKFTYTKEVNAQSGTDLVVTINGDAGGTLRLQDFQDGDYGIRLWNAHSNPQTTRDIFGDQDDSQGTDDLGNPIGNSVPNRDDRLYGSRPTEPVAPDAPGDKIEAGGGNDVILSDRPNDSLDNGLGNADWIVAGGGRDDVDAGAGNDLVEAGADGVLGGDAGGDLVYGGLGDDEIYSDVKVSLSDALIHGELNNPTNQKGDFLSGGAGDDWIVADRANDVLMGGGGQDLLVGENGDDTIFGDGGDVASQFAWTVTRTESNGNYQAAFTGTVTLDASAGGADVVYGGSGQDWVFGGVGDDFIHGGSGEDVLFGEAGSDIILGGSEKDVLVGDNPGVVGEADEGSDYLDGGAGDDTLQGNGGDDFLVGGPGDDTMSGGAGKDIYIFNKGDGQDTVSDTPNDADAADASVLILGSGFNPNSIKFRLGSLFVDLGPLDPNDPGAPSEGIHFEGFDQVDPASTPVIAAIQFEDGTVMTYADILAQGFDIDGTELDDSGDPGENAMLVGTGVTDRIRGFGGDDVLAGIGGDDTLDGGDGNDIIVGGAGSDTLIGGLGADQLQGGSGNDVLQGGDDNDELFGDADDATEATSGNDVLDGGAGDDFLTGNSGDDTLYGGDGVDTLYGAWGADVLEGGAGDDVLYGDAVYFSDGQFIPNLLDDFAADTLRGGDGNDTLNSGGGDDLLEGGAGDDQLVAEGGADTLQGDAGNDTAWGGAGDDVLAGGTGNDLLVGESGNDTYLFNLADQRDRIEEDGAIATDVLRFGPGIVLADLTFSRVGGDLVITHANATDEVTVVNWYAGAGFQMTQIEFPDGSQLTAAEAGELGLRLQRGTAGNDIMAGTSFDDTLYGLAGNDTISGNAGNDALIGGTGNDVLNGGAGGDAYLMELGDGQDQVNDTSGSDTLSFGAGIAKAEITVSRVGQDVLLANVNGTDSVALKDWFNDVAKQVEVVTFSQTGESFAHAELTDPFLALAGTAGNDVIFGGNAYGETLQGFAGLDELHGGGGDDLITGGLGNDELWGDTGFDRFFFQAGDGQDIIHDSDGFGIVQFGPNLVDKVVITSVTNGRQVTFTGLGDSVFIENPTNGGFNSLIIKFELNGTNAADTLDGSAFGDVVQGLGGNDVIHGNGGNDEIFGGAGNDTIEGGAGSDILDGGDGDDTLDGNLLADTVTGGGVDRYFGGPGNDTLNGNSGSDIYFFNLGDGQDLIDDQPFVSGSTFFFSPEDEVIFGPGISAETLSGGRSGNDLIVNISPTDRITIKNQLFDAVYQIDRFTFSDGSTLDVAGINDLQYVQRGTSGNDTLTGDAGVNRLYGLAGDDTLSGLEGNDLIDGGTGNDLLNGGLQDDVYVIRPGDGQDVITDAGGTDTVQFEAGLSASGITLGRDGNSLVLSVDGTSDRVTITDYLKVPPMRVESFVFADGSQLPTEAEILDQLVNVRGTSGDDALTGSSGFDAMFGEDGDDTLTALGDDDQLFGGAGSDTLVGGAGNDQLFGEAGDDVYQYALGDGQDAVSDSSGFDVVAFGTGIATTDVTATRSGSDLMLGVNVTGNTGSVTVQNYFNGQETEEIRFSDGTTWDVATVRAMILAASSTSGNDVILGYESDDTINALGGNDTVYGFAGNDAIDGGPGDDTMYGGTGDDTYIVDSTSDQAIENPGEGTDTISTDLSWTLGANLENLTLTGSSNRAGTGNELGNTIIGNSGRNTLTGGDGNDWLDGGTNRDTLVGGTGDDTYVVDQSGDSITENANEGIDTVRSPITWTLGANLENLVLTGTGNINATGNALANVLTGNAGDNVLSASDGNDVLDGGTGADSMTGGTGDDAYVVDNAGDAVTESAGQGTDTVQSSITYTLGTNVENLTLIGAAAINGSGNSLANTLAGNSAANTLAGNAGNDTYLFGYGAGMDTVEDSDATAGNTDRILVTAGIAPSQVGGTHTATHRILSLNAQDQMAIRWDPATGYQVEQVEFGDGTVWDVAALLARTNNAPTVANPLADQEAIQDQAFTFTVAADAFVDPDAVDSLAYTASLSDGSPLPGWLSFDVGTHTFSGTPGSGDIGTLSVRVTATDNEGAAGSDLFDLVVGTGNNPPTVANPLADQSATEDQPFSFTVAADAFADVDAGDTLTYSATLADGSALPGWLGFDAPTRAFSGTPLNADVGTISVKVTATDGASASAFDVFDLTVANTNDAPTVASPIADQTATEDQAFSFTVPADIFADVDIGDSLTYSASLADGSVLPGWLAFDALTRTFSGTPANGDVGVLSVKVTATDGSSASAFDLFDLTVSNSNDAPTVANPIGDQAAIEDQVFSFTVPANTFADVDMGDTLAYGATLADGSALPGWLAFDAPTRTFSGTPANGDVGSISVRVTATDGASASASDVFELTVANTNDAPVVANPIADQSTTEAQAFSFTVPADTFADVDFGDTLTYAASLADGSALPGWLAFDALSRTFSGTPANGDIGTISIKITATDGASASADDVFDLLVLRQNSAPTVANPIADQGATEDQLLTFMVPVDSFADPDPGDTLTYAASLPDGSALPAWLAFDGQTRTFSGTPTNTEVGTLSVRVTATDTIGASVSDVFDIAVANTNDAPVVANAIDDQVATEDQVFSFTVPANTFADVDVGDNLTYSASLTDGSLLPSWLSFDVPTRTFSGTPVNGDVGTTGVKVTATDGASASVFEVFDLTVNNTNDAPTVANPVADQAATEDQVFSFTVPANTFADVDAGNTLTYGASLSNGSALPGWLAFDAPTRTFSGTPLNADVGTISVKVTATDGASASAFDVFDLTVANTNDAPTVANPIADQSATEDQAFSFTVPVNAFADVDVGDSLAYSASLADGSALPSWLSFDALTRTFSGMPANGDVGVLSVKVTATDGSSASAFDVFDLTIANTNDAPTVANPIADQTATEDQAFSFTVPANTFADVDVGDMLAYSATLADGSALPGWLAFDAPTRAFSGTPMNADVGTLSVKVTATDGASASVFDVFDITIANTNDAPTVANPIPDQTATQDEAFSFTVSTNAFADVDVGDTLAYSASLADDSPLPGWLSFDALSRTFSGTPTSGDVGTLGLRVNATDGSSASVDDVFDLVINTGNNPPVLENPLADQTGTEGQQFSFMVPADTFSDVDAGDTLAYTASLVDGSALPLWLAFDGPTRTFTGTPPSDGAGLLTIRVTATDNANASAFDEFALDVANLVSGTSSGEVLNGTAGRDVMEGHAGNDEMHGLAGNDTLFGGTGGDTLFGEDGDDVLDARAIDGSGAPTTGDTLIGGVGDDVYLFGSGTWSASVNETPGSVDDGFDTILIDADLTPSDVRIRRDSETTLQILSLDFSYSLRVNGQFSRNGPGTTTIEQIRFAVDGTTWDLATIDQMVATPTSGNDYLWGSDLSNDVLQGLDGADNLHAFDGDDTLDGGAGDDWLDGGAGNDTYVFGLGYGADSIMEYLENSDADVLLLGAGITPAGVTLNRPDDSLVISVNGTTDEIKIWHWFTAEIAIPEAYIVEEIRFADGTIWTDETIGSFYPIDGTAGSDTLQGTGRADTINGLGGSDTLNGMGGNDTLDGGAGADTMYAGTGDDTYIVDSTSDQIIEGAGQGLDTVISSVSWTLGADVENLVLSGTSNLSGTGNSLDNAITGNSGRNTLTGGAGSDWLDGGENRDTLVGGTGDDTYVVDHGSDSITENANEGIDTVRSTLAWTLGSNLENLALLGTANIDGTGNSLANILTGNSGDNTLTGNAGNDTLDGQAGADTLIGGTGNDTYLLGRGHGAELVQENDTTSGNTDIGQFLANIAPEQVWFRRSGSNLEVSVIGTPDQFTIQNWYSGSQYRLEQFRTADGQTLMEAQVQNLVDAMAAFSPPPPGQETLPPEYATQLNPVIAANWQ